MSATAPGIELDERESKIFRDGAISLFGQTQSEEEDTTEESPECLSQAI